MSAQPDLFEPTSLPVSGRTPRARHASWTGAIAAAEGRGELTRRYLELLGFAGALSDQTAARMLGCNLSSINSVRDGCGDLVRDSGRYESVTWTTPRGTERTTKRIKWERAN